MTDAPAEFERLRTRLADVGGLKNALAVLFWDQNTYMPPAGAAARGEACATVEGLIHRAIADPEVGRLLVRLESWAGGLAPDDDRRLEVDVVRRDHEKAVRVPERLLADIARSSALGQQAWMEAREARDYGRFRDALALQIEQRREYSACFPAFAHPYDALVDDFEPEMTVAQLRPLFADLTAELTPLVAAAAGPADPPFPPSVDVATQRAALMDVLEGVGFDARSWRLDVSVHPFAQSPGMGDLRVTTDFREHEMSFAIYSGLHEFGHALYEAGVRGRPDPGVLEEAVSLGVHESQSRMWENLVGRSRPFCEWVVPVLNRHLGGALEVDGFHRALNSVTPSLIRTEADETTYNLHVALRFELETALFEGTLAVDELPDAWDAGMLRLLGVEVLDVNQGVLQDIHWGCGMIGYFPTYTLGNLLAAQMWERVRTDLPDLDEALARGDFAPLREWLLVNVHRLGRRHLPRELARRVTGREVSSRPFLDYLRSKLSAAGVIVPAALGTAGATPPSESGTPVTAGSGLSAPPAGGTPAAA